jgi:LacI family transcriptional regulator
LRLRRALTNACSILDKRIVVHRRIVREADETSLVKAIIKPSYRRSGLIVAAPDTQVVRNALRTVLDQGEAVVTVVSNVADVQGIAYFGIDNYRAGRTAGVVMGRFARRPGRVMFLSGRNDWAAHQQRTAGCRDALTSSFRNLLCDSSPFETLDDEYRCHVAVSDAMRSTEIAGIYNSGAGSVRGRDVHCWTPPAQIRTSPIRASGSYLGGVTAKRRSGACRTRSSAWVTRARL